MATGADSLSDLPDELLLRVLHFLPVKEAASTAVLSRRWGAPLWRSSGAVNIETRIQDYQHKKGESDNALYFTRRDAFFSAASAALDAADVPVTRLTLLLEPVCYWQSADRFLYYDSDESLSPDRDFLTSLLSHQAARRIEKLRIAIENGPSIHVDKDDEMASSSRLQQVGIFTLILGSLPSETLRVLDITNCRELVPLPPDTAVVFRRLSSLRLRHCTAPIGALQSLFDTAPALAAVHLERVTLPTDDASGTAGSHLQPTKSHLCCPAATVLVLDRCSWKQSAWTGNYTVLAVEISTPRLRSFTYKGLLRPFSMSPPPPDLAWADLHFVQLPPPRHNQTRDRDLITFWQFLESFASAKELKLRVKVNALEHIAVRSKARSLELLPVLANVHRLELQGKHRATGKTAAVAISNLLRCCPALRDLRINLTAVSDHDVLYLERNDCCSTLVPTTVTPEGIAGDVNYDEVPAIPCLIGRSFDCLQSSVRRVGLQFRSSDANCLGVKLIKFFVENAMVLEEMYIDGGNEKLQEHMTRKVQRWIADSSIKRKAGASRFVVLPLKRL